MMKRNLMFLLLLCLGVNQLLAAFFDSPDKNLKLNFNLNDKGTPTYSLSYKNKDVIKESKMGLRVRINYNLDRDFIITDTKYSSSNSTWKPVWGENSSITDNHNEMVVSLEQKKTGFKMNLRFRLFNDGLGFRYEFPVQKNFRFIRHFE